MDCSPPGSSVHGILQARILEWVAIPFSPGDLPDAEIEPVFLCPLHWQAGSLPFAPPEKPIYYVYVYIFAYVLYIYSIYLSTYFWPHYGVWGILVPRPGIKPTPPAVELQSLPLDHQGSPWKEYFRRLNDMLGSPNLSQELTPKIPFTKKLSKRCKQKSRIKSNPPPTPVSFTSLKIKQGKAGFRNRASVCQTGVPLCRLSTLRETCGHSRSLMSRILPYKWNVQNNDQKGQVQKRRLRWNKGCFF